MRVCQFLIPIAGAIGFFLSEPGSAFTIGQFESTRWAGVRGQSFTPNQLGADGSGTLPSRGRAFLRSFTFAYQSEIDRTATVLYIHDRIPDLVDLNNGAGDVLLQSVGYLDSIGIDPRFNFPSRTFIFESSSSLVLSEGYSALFSEGQAIRISSDNNPYSGGSRYWVQNGNLSFRPTGVDTAFAADLEPVGIPFGFNPIFGLIWFALFRLKNFRL
jgi:hypothetical protein